MLLDLWCKPTHSNVSKFLLQEIKWILLGAIFHNNPVFSLTNKWFMLKYQQIKNCPPTFRRIYEFKEDCSFSGFGGLRALRLRILAWQ